MELYHSNALQCSKITTLNYSTSFSLGIKLFDKKYHAPIYAIYGFVRFADEIVDTFHDHNKHELLTEFINDTWKAIERQISTNPILHSFQRVVHEYNIDHEHIQAFLESMQMDLSKEYYTNNELKRYIYGSAEVIGLMCLKIFYKDEPAQYDRLSFSARKLGEAFQKINFLRDIGDDYFNKGRQYFASFDLINFRPEIKSALEQEIYSDFEQAYSGILELKKEVRWGIYLAYRYYTKLLYNIQSTSPKELLERRYRVSNSQKAILLIKSYLRHKADMLKN